MVGAIVGGTAAGIVVLGAILGRLGGAASFWWFVQLQLILDIHVLNSAVA